MRWVLLGLLAAGALYATVSIVSLAGPIGWKPLPVAPLFTGQQFQVELVLGQDDGYVLAGIAGTNEPGDDGRCTGRFALVSLDERGSARRAVVASGPERDSMCAHRVESVFPDEAGGWSLSGWGERRGKPSKFVPGETDDHELYVLRFSADGTSRRGFGEHGLVRDALAAARVGKTLVTEDLERVTDDGTVRDDLLAVPGSPFPTWSAIVSAEDLLVAFDEGLPLSFQTFAVEGSHDSILLRALTPEPKYPARMIHLGDALFSKDDVVLHDGRLYVVLRREGAAGLFAVDPRRRRLVRSFGRVGSVTVRAQDHVESAALAVDRRGRLVVAFSTLHHIHPDRLYVRRFSADGSLDLEFGGLVRESKAGTDLHVTGVLVDSDGRAIVVDQIESTLTRVTQAGRLDRSFGRGGVVSLADVVVCELPPARRGRACRER